MSTPGIETIYNDAHRRLRRVTRDFYLVKAGYQLLQLIFYALALFLGFSLLELLFDLTSPVRIGFWVLLLGLAAGMVGRRLLPSLRCAFFPGESELIDISRRIGKENPSVQDALINFLQIYHEQGIGGHPALKNLSLKQLYQRFKDSDFYQVVSFRILKQPAYRLLIIGLIFGLLFIGFPTSMSQAVQKVLFPTRSFQQPLPVTVTNLSGTLTVLKNDPVELRGEYEGVTPHQLWLVLQSKAGDSDSITVERVEIPLAAGRTFSHHIPHVKNDFIYWFEAYVEMAAFRHRPALSAQGKVRVKERPYVRELQARLTYPEYTRLPAALLPPNSGEVTALKGTTVSLHLVANKRLSSAVLDFDEGEDVPLQVIENRARGEFVVTREDRYRIRILDIDSIPNFQPVTYSVFVLSDEFPFVEIAQPGQDLDLGDELKIPMLINLRDDFGFSRLLLKGRHVHAGSSGDTTEFTIPLSYHQLDQSRAIAEFSWDLAPLYMVPDDFVEYYAEVYDNDRVSGPKSARSKTYIIRLPSLMEVLEQSEEQLAEEMKDTEDIARETEELRQKLEEINRDLKREQELSWERKQEIQTQMEQQKQVLEKLQEIQQELEEIVENLDQQKLLSPEALEKYFELQKMFQELATPELMEAMKALQEALEEADMEEVKKAMERFQLSVEEFERRIERTYELFKRVEMERKMDQLTQMAEQLTEEQKKINEQVEEKAQEKDLTPAEQEQLANQEQNLQENTEYFQEKLEQAREEFEQMMAEMAEELEQIREFMEQQGLTEQMQQMQQQLQQGQMQSAQQTGQDLQRQLEMLQSMMQQAQQQMNQQMKQEVLQAMQKVQQDMLQASYQQERLMQRSQQTGAASPQVPEIARQQARLRENATHIIKQLIDISKQTFFISPQMSRIMSQLMNNMQEALQSLENRNPRSAARSQQEAMANFNQAIMSMQNSMNQLMQSGSASGFEQFLQQLQQMAGQQGQLNQETLSLFQQQGKGRLKLDSEALARLAAQQEMIRRSLEQLHQQMGNRKDVLGRLGDLGQEMQEVVEDLRKQRVDKRLIERQQRILSRLLDAQRSVREKEYSRKRQAEREEVRVTQSPPELKRELLERENKLRKDLLEALKEGYSSEYKEFIKAYYEILSRQAVEQR